MNHNIQLPLNILPLISQSNYSCDPEGFVHPDRIMDVNVLLYVEKGYFHLWEEDTEYTVNAGNMIFLKQGLHHFGEGKCPPGTSWFYIHFNLPEDKPGHETDLNSGLLYKEGASDGDIHSFYTLPKELRHVPGNITAGFHTLNEMVQSNDPEMRIMANAYLYRILLEIYCEGVLRPRAGSAEQRVRDLMTILEEHKNSPFDSSIPEKSMGLSYKHLNVLFKDVTGQTMQKYHCHIRMREAARLLKETTMSIGEISNRLGFEEAFYFSNCFKKEYGISPAHYRKQGVFI